MQGVTGNRRWSRRNPCPICGGYDALERGEEKRCHGFMSGDGAFIHCAREEHAGALKQSPNSMTYGHRREGECGCGVTHNDLPEPPRRAAHNGSGTGQAPRRVSRLPSHDALYTYRNEDGVTEFVVTRHGHGPGKRFLQWRPDGAGGWLLGLRDEAGTSSARRVLYRLPELLAADLDEPVYVVEGEKAADALRAIGVEATCSPGGAGKWHLVDPACVQRALAGRHVVLLPDNDGPGKGHAGQVARAIFGFAASLRRIDLNGLPDKGDAYDWITAGGDALQLEALRSSTSPGVDIGEATIGRGSTPTGSTPAPPDPFVAALSKAKSEVGAALGADKNLIRVPLFFEARELFKREYPKTPWLVSGLITRGGVALLGAEPKSGKTWLATEIAIAIATGTRVCGKFYAERGIVAYFYAEDLDVQVRNRVRALAGGRQLAPDAINGLYVCPRGKFLDVTKDEDLAWIIASCRVIGKVDAVVLDPLRDIHSGEEDKSDSMRDVMRRLRLVSELLGCTVIVAHHKSKANKDTKDRRPGQTMRGSGVIHGSTDSGIYFGIRGGDGVAKFELDVDVEIKGARSAGRFLAMLDVEDDEAGEAVVARWGVTRGDATPKSAATEERSAMDNFSMLSFIRELAAKDVFLTKTQICRYENKGRGPDEPVAPFADQKRRRIIDYLLQKGRLSQDAGEGSIIRPGAP